MKNIQASGKRDSIPYVKRDLSKEEKRVRDWLRKNWGALGKVATEYEISRQSVHKIAYGRFSGHSRDWRVERALKAAGCPGIKVG